MVTEIVPLGYVASTPTFSGPHGLFSSDSLSLGFVFGNFCPVDVQAPKFFDFDWDGAQDDNKQNLAVIKICLNGEDCQITNDEGLVSWEDVRPGPSR